MLDDASWLSCPGAASEVIRDAALRRRPGALLHQAVAPELVDQRGARHAQDLRRFGARAARLVQRLLDPAPLGLLQLLEQRGRDLRVIAEIEVLWPHRPAVVSQ